jgi:hypothetical protein
VTRTRTAVRRGSSSSERRRQLLQVDGGMALQPAIQSYLVFYYNKRFFSVKRNRKTALSSSQI